MVGKGEGSEPPIELDTMLDLTAAAEVDGVKFDGFDLFLFDPHVEHRRFGRRTQDAGRQGAKARPGDRLGRGAGVAADRRRLGHGRARSDRKKFLDQVRKGCRIARRLREMGVRPYGVVRIDSATGVGELGRRRPQRQQQEDRRDLPQACDIAEDHGERLAAEGEICWGGMHSWRRMLQLLEMVDRPKTLGFQADMAHTLLYVLGLQRPGRRDSAGGLRLEGHRQARRRASSS